MDKIETPIDYEKLIKLRTEYLKVVKINTEKKRKIRYDIGEILSCFDISISSLYKTLKKSTKIKLGSSIWWFECLNIYLCISLINSTDPSMLNDLNKIPDLLVAIAGSKKDIDLIKHIIDIYLYNPNNLAYLDMLKYVRRLKDVNQSNVGILKSTTNIEHNLIDTYYTKLIKEKKLVDTKIQELTAQSSELSVAIKTVSNLLKTINRKKSKHNIEEIPQPGEAHVLTLR